MKQEKKSILIIGAGAAGLMAANELADEFQITILEALDRLGGRIHTLYTDDHSVHFEAGAEFIHGKLPVTLSLVKKAGLHAEKTGGNFYEVSDCEWTIRDEMMEGWDELLDTMTSLREDLTLDAFLETHFPAPEYEELRRHTRAYAAGFDLADSTKVSTQALYKEWSGEYETQYRIKEGYQSLIDYLQQQCLQKGVQILTGKRVKQIDWQKDDVTVYTLENEIFRGDKIIITIPAGVLQKSISFASINLTPALDEYDTAWQNIGYGSVVKLILIFKKPFWKNEQKDIGFVLSDEMIPTWWTQLPSDMPVLTGWLGGPAAVQYDNKTDEELIEFAVLSLSKIFRKTADEIIELLTEHHIFRWHADKTASGAYSYDTPLSKEARQILKAPVENTIYFAGEALYEGDFPGTVEAAFTNGLETAEKIKS